MWCSYLLFEFKWSKSHNTVKTKVGFSWRICMGEAGCHLKIFNQINLRDWWANHFMVIHRQFFQLAYLLFLFICVYVNFYSYSFFLLSLAWIRLKRGKGASLSLHRWQILNFSFIIILNIQIQSHFFGPNRKCKLCCLKQVLRVVKEQKWSEIGGQNNSNSWFTVI